MNIKQSFRWENFKSLTDTGWINLKPITIFLGYNGSGKSSIFQPLLMLSQTLKSADKSMALMPRGEYINGGTYKDIVSNHEDQKNIVFSFKFYEVLGASGSSDVPEIGNAPPGKMSLIYEKDDLNMPRLREVNMHDCFDRPLLVRRWDGKTGYTCKMPKPLKAESVVEKSAIAAIKKQLPSHFLFDDDEIISHIFNFETHKAQTKLSLSGAAGLYVATISFVEMLITRFLSSIKYIGPLREYPKRYYEFRGESHSYVGPKGEFTYSLLFQLCKNENAKATLDKWLDKFQLAKGITCKALEGRTDLLEIIVSDYHRAITNNFADSCIGVSQILPVLVQSLMAESGDVIIAEQPEIHLNPMCEIALADFFVEQVTQKKVKYIIETHSEHYFMRLRTLIKKGKIKARDVGIYFSDITDGKPHLRQLDINDLGNFTNKDWPKGFFEQALSEALTFATAKKER